MKKNIFAGLVIALVCAVGVGTFAPSASALTVDELQTQIRQLLAKVADLTKQMNELRGQSSATLPDTSSQVPMKHRICSVLYRNLGQGIQGDDVQSLQEFLSEEGYLSANPTGYFGPMTMQAVSKWQAAQGVQSVGSVGPMTRERIKLWCGDKARFAATPQRGLAPLDVTFKAMVGGFTPNQYFVDFGDGSARAQVSCYAPTDYCIRPGVVNHTYTQDGVYTAALYEYNPGGCGPNADPSCLGAPARESVLAKEQIHVGKIECTKEYNPICGSKPIVCITTPCNPIQQTYGNRCAMEADGATFVHEGSCRDTSTNPADDLRCKTWNDGCNSCSRSESGAPAACTLRYCAPESMQKPYCTAYFDDKQCPALPPAPCRSGYDIKWSYDAKGCRVSSQCVVSGNKSPTISSFSGPTTLATNVSGTWTISASDPENQQLSYHVTWGDEYSAVSPYAGMSMMQDAFVQATTFTHVYANAGIYTVVIVVRDSAGMEAKTSATVRVGSENIACTATMEYAPVCGRPAGCANTCAAGMYCTAVCQL